MVTLLNLAFAVTSYVYYGEDTQQNVSRARTLSVWLAHLSRSGDRQSAWRSR